VCILHVVGTVKMIIDDDDDDDNYLTLQCDVVIDRF